MKILVFNPAYLGDSVLTTPLIKLIKEKIPQSKVYFCIRPENRALFDGLPFIDEIIIFDKRGKDKGIIGFFRFLKKLKSYNFDYILSAHRYYRTSFLIFFLSASKRIGFSSSKLSFVYDLLVERDMSIPEVKRNCNLLKPIVDFGEDEIKEPEVVYDKNFYKNLSNFLSIIREDYKLAIVNPMSVWETKRWPYERFAELINVLYKEYKIISIVCGAPNEIDIFYKMKPLINVPFINIAGRTSLTQLSSYIKYADIVITGDTGPMHIGRSFMKPMVIIYGATTPNIGFAPDYNSIKIAEVKDLYCRPCGIHGGEKCPEKHFKCMMDIEVKDIIRYVEELL